MRPTIADTGRLRTISYIERWIKTMHATDEPVMGHSVRGSLSQRSDVLASMVMLDACSQLMYALRYASVRRVCLPNFALGQYLG